MTDVLEWWLFFVNRFVTRPSVSAMRSSSTDWLTEEREADLIDMWQARPVLYEVVSKGYSNRNLRMVALTEIAEEMGTTSK